MKCTRKNKRYILRPACENQENRRGAMLVLIATMMSMFMIALVFTVDVAYMQLVRTELRVSADASAKAGMEALVRTEKTSSAIVASKNLVQHNGAAGQQIQIIDNDVEFGRPEVNPNGTWTFLPNVQPYSAIRVTVSMTEDSPNSPVPLFFGRILGYSNFTPKQSAVAANLTQEIILCLDRSHSMCFDESGHDWQYPSGTPSFPSGYITPPNPVGSRWAALDGAIQRFVATVGLSPIQPDVGVVTWGSSISLSNYWQPYGGHYTPATIVDVPLGQNLGDINGVIADKYNDIMMGGTNMSAGIDKSVDLLTDPSTNSLAQKTIILMSDGQWNSGRNPTKAAIDAAGANIVIHTISFLATADQQTMKKIASITGGRSYIAPNAETLERVFEELAKIIPVVLIN
ncbi:MAG: VWA domain-containing protein [Planctomycetaceae bacterium]|nr:VWA domain-containing protein [Planctomycetaceae bacterium]